MLSNAYFLAIFRFDTAENEPAKKFAKFYRSSPGPALREGRRGPAGRAPGRQRRAGRGGARGRELQPLARRGPA